MDLRKAFFEQMCKLADKDPNVILLVGDLGFGFMETYAMKYSDQFLNIGASEQHMIGMAQGLALAGKKPYVYSGAIFAIMRPYEQVRHACYNNLDIKIIGTGASGFLGWTHNLTGTENEEDLLKNLPNLKRFYPSDEAELAIALTNKGISYIRL